MWWRRIAPLGEIAWTRWTPTASAVRNIAETLCDLFTLSARTVRSG
jgi:hypothetical protein